MSAKRVFIATLFGFITGLLCILGGRYGLKIEMTPAQVLIILLHRGLLGFVIGISALRMHWAIHGILLGFIVGLPFVVKVFFGQADLLIYFVMGAVYGFIIELFTSVVFRAKAVRT